jgi:transcriptional regulator NrdR family protein
MAITVIKKDGRKEPYELKKVVNSCTATGAPDKVAEQIAHEIADELEYALREKVKTEEIREMVLGKLRIIQQEWVDSWEEYEKTSGKE